MSTQDVFFHYANPLFAPDLLGGGVGSEVQVGTLPSGSGVVSLVQGVALVAPFTPDGSKIQEVSALVKAAALGSPGDEMVLRLVRWAPTPSGVDNPFLPPTTIAAAGSLVNTTAVQEIVAPVSDHIVDPAFIYALVLQMSLAGNAAFLGSVRFKGR